MENITENDSILLNFIGISYNESIYTWVINSEEWDNGYDSSLLKLDSLINNNNFPLKFKVSYDWIMCIIDKINSIHTMESNGLMRTIEFLLNGGYGKSKKIDFSVGNLYLACLEFINWYNISERNDNNEYKKCFDKFGIELKEGDIVDVQVDGEHQIYKKDGQLYFKPYGIEDMVCAYFSNDIVKVK